VKWQHPWTKNQPDYLQKNDNQIGYTISAIYNINRL